MDGREKKDTSFKHHFLTYQTENNLMQNIQRGRLSDMWDSLLERWVFIRSLTVGYFLREKIREIRPQKTSGLGGWHPADTSPSTRPHLEEMLNLVTTSLTICHSNGTNPSVYSLHTFPLFRYKRLVHNEIQKFAVFIFLLK